MSLDDKQRSAFGHELARRASLAAAERDSHIRLRVQEEIAMCVRDSTKITVKELDELFKRMDGLNSYEREALAPHLSDECLAQQVEQCLKHCTRKHGGAYDPCSTYDEALVHLFAPILVERLRAKGN